jgi:hypothetical protein
MGAYVIIGGSGWRLLPERIYINSTMVWAGAAQLRHILAANKVYLLTILVLIISSLV